MRRVFRPTSTSSKPATTITIAPGASHGSGGCPVTASVLHDEKNVGSAVIGSAKLVLAVRPELL